ncbi:MAG: BREX system P-loop protein BrxC [Gemmatimonadetes bacterium]|nr:BREX system P-loop protein BrxC [Gemmatimonadota bacterium]
MKIKDLLLRDPLTHPLANNGQARIVDSPDAQSVDEIRKELETFVCEGRYADGIERILSSFLGGLGQTSQRAAWVSGFFGSGKSHLLKMLCHLWQNTAFPDGATARGLVTDLPAGVKAQLKELDTAGRRHGGLLAAAGALPSGSTDTVRLTILSIILRAAGLPGQFAQASFVLWLHEQGYLDAVKSAVTAGGRAWEKEVNNLYVSPFIARAVLSCDAAFASSEAQARETLRTRFASPKSDIDTKSFTTMAREALTLAGRGGELPCTLIVLDEMQQYVGTSYDRSVAVTEAAEALSKEMSSRIVVVGAGQSALTDVSLLHKMMDRFSVRVPLADADVETVTRKVLLQKKATALGQVHATLAAHAGEISRQLQGTRIAERTEDLDVIVDDYPLLPVRRRFWEESFRQADPAGTHSQLRSQLRIIHDAVRDIADESLGAVVPADVLYNSLAPVMVVTGVLPREIDERITALGKKGGPNGELERRVCSVAFLIGKLPREGGADIGVRATTEHIADLLVSDLTADNGRLRHDVGETLVRLAKDGVLMQVGDEFRLQTREGSDWDREFRNRQTRLGADPSTVQHARERILYAELDRVVKSLKIQQGYFRQSRTLVLHHDDTPPSNHPDAITIWVRDEWSGTLKEHVDAARRAGSESPMLFAFIPKLQPEDLRKAVIDAEAADQTLGVKGSPASPEGIEARRGMESRRLLAQRERDELVRRAVAAARVFQGGGTELLQLEVNERLKAGAEDSCVRLFPQFKHADATSASWEAVIKRAREGGDTPFQPVGHAGATELHPVCQQVITTIGAGKVGTEVRKALEGAPFGWPRDAVDAALIALHRSQQLTATLNGAPVALGQLDQNRIPKAEFRVEKRALPVHERIGLRKLYLVAGVGCKSGEEGAKAQEFLSAALAMAAAAGGDEPLPDVPAATDIADLARMVGNEQLAAIYAMESDLTRRLGEWKAQGEMIAERKPTFDLVSRLAGHARGLTGADEALSQLEAVCRGRSLLAPINPVSAIRATLTGVLRAEVQSVYAMHAEAHRAGIASLETSDVWPRLPALEGDRILAQVGLNAPVAPMVGDDSALLRELDARSLAARRAEGDAVAGRVAQALQMAAKVLEPKVRPISIERATLRDDADVKAWLARQEVLLTREVALGPVLVN